MKAEWALGKHFRREFVFGWGFGHPGGTPVWQDSFVISTSLDPPFYGFAGSALTFVQFDDSSVNALKHGGNVSPDTKHILRVERNKGGSTGVGVGGGLGLLYDRVGDYEGCTIANSTQTMVNTLTPQRYVSAGQEGLQVLAGCQTTTGATAANFTGHYTDNAGNLAQSFPTTATTLAHATSAVAPIPGDVLFPVADLVPTSVAEATTPFLPLPSVNSGVREIEDYIFSAANTGTFYLALVHPLAYVVNDNLSYGAMDMMNNYFNLARIYDGACLSMIFKEAGGTNSGGGLIETVWG
jgi:hypothetical protein